MKWSNLLLSRRGELNFSFNNDTKYYFLISKGSSNFVEISDRNFKHDTYTQPSNLTFIPSDISKDANRVYSKL